MTRQQRYQYEMFLRLVDFGVKYPQLFGSSTQGPQFLAAVAAALAAIDQNEKDRLIGKVAAGRVKATTRQAAYRAMRNLAAVARRLTKHEQPNTLFRLPRHRTLRAELASAHLLLDAALPREAELVAFGLKPTFMGEFKRLVSDLEVACNTKNQAKLLRKQSRTGVVVAVKKGLEAARDLDAIVRAATADDEAAFETWRTARRIEGQRGSSSPRPTTGAASESPKSTEVKSTDTASGDSLKQAS